uniref:Cytochrome c oxidase subunit 4 n=1 Tax=Strongyloides venezuelensis TaxID=75913 RepID=A0A0K0G296_STRVS
MSLSRNLQLSRCTNLAKFIRSIHLTRPATGHSVEYWWGHEMAAGREIVGHGYNGDELYQDRLDNWYPSIRFRKEDSIIAPIRKKEFGDWKALSNEEKKLLYRYSYKQTLAEFEAPTGYWKVITGSCLILLGLTTLYATLLSNMVFKNTPPTIENEYKEAAVERKLVLEKGWLVGPAKHYDYENNQWKK